MADQQEQFSYEEYKTYKRVAKILTEEGGETESQGSSEYIKNKSESDDPGEAYRERQRKPTKSENKNGPASPTSN